MVMKGIKKYFSNMNEIRVESKKVIFLEVFSALCFGLVIGMLISPRKNLTIGSNNSGNGCHNGNDNVPESVKKVVNKDRK